MAHSHSSLSAARAPLWFVWLGILALAAYGTLIGLNATIAAGGSDSSGYLNSAQLLASGRLAIPARLPPTPIPAERVPPEWFQPLGFAMLEGSSQLAPTYPAGFPLHVAVTSKLLGWSWGPRFIEVAAALAALLLCYAVGRELGLSRALAASGAVVLAVCPAMLFAAIQPLSDMLATTWCLAAVWSALRARLQDGWAVVCGAAYGIAVLVRPTNIVLLPALVTLLGFNGRRLTRAILGGLPFAAWLAYYNHSLYGGAFRSGYLNWSEFFALEYFAPASSFFLHWLIIFLPAILLVLPVAAFWRRDTRTRELFAIACWFAGITGVHLFVAFSHEAWTCLRYLLPALPALILAGMLGVESVARSLAAPPASHLRNVAAVFIAGWAVAGSWLWSPRHGVFHVKLHEDAYITASAEARAQLPPNTVVLCCHLSGAVFYYTGFPVLRWDGLNAAEFIHYAETAQRAGITLAALLFSEEEEPALRERCPGDWTRLATVGNIGLWQLATVPAKSGKE